MTKKKGREEKKGREGILLSNYLMGYIKVLEGVLWQCWEKKPEAEAGVDTDNLFNMENMRELEDKESSSTRNYDFKTETELEADIF